MLRSSFPTSLPPFSSSFLISIPYFLFILKLRFIISFRRICSKVTLGAFCIPKFLCGCLCYSHYALSYVFFFFFNMLNVLFHIYSGDEFL